MDQEPLGARELELLEHVAQHAPLSVGEAAEQFGEPLGLGRTTVLVMMERLRKKGFLVRQKAPGERAYQYRPRRAQSDVLRGMVGEFVDRMLGGSLSPFVAYIADARGLSDAEMEELQRLLDKLEAQPREEP